MCVCERWKQEREGKERERERKAQDMHTHSRGRLRYMEKGELGSVLYRRLVAVIAFFSPTRGGFLLV